MNLNEIDSEIRSLIFDLNNNGFVTWSSCQGKQTEDDYKSSSHCDHAFITFEDYDLLKKLRRKTNRLGLSIYNGGISITPRVNDDNRLEMMEANKKFSEKVRKLFNI